MNSGLLVRFGIKTYIERRGDFFFFFDFCLFVFFFLRVYGPRLRLGP